MLRKKDKLYKRYITDKTIENKNSYKNVRNLYFHTLSRKKHEYYQQKFQPLRQKLKATWKMLNNIMSRNKQNHNNSSVIISDNEVTDYQLIANKFNEYFSTVAEKLMEKIPHTNQNPLKYLENQPKSSLFLSATSPWKIKKYLMRFLQSIARDGMTYLQLLLKDHQTMYLLHYHIYSSCHSMLVSFQIFLRRPR